ncbi:MAG TPA: serine/threonine-protein kinase [Gemmatimonadales bacterium]|nr:serine/threonine-protein kinase [Gemmatimonadales bacterium]
MSGADYLAPGDALRGRYEIVREVGRGGYSVVYLARDRELDCDVAVKLLVPPPAAAQVARERMRREVQAVRGLSHANIVAVFDFLEEGPWSFIVMEYVRGSDLQVRVGQRGRLDPDAAVRLGRDVAGALSAAHRRGILHRDVKPQNILLEPDGRARLTDFGSAKLDGQLGVTGSGTLAGTLAYTAPETLAGRRGDARADVYALGLTLYYALTGDLPERTSAHLPPAAIATGFRPRTVVPAVPEWLDQVVAHATAAAPADRFPTAAAFGEALAQPGAAGALLMDSGTACLLCGGPDPLALGLCPACGGSADTADTLVFVRAPSGAAERRSVALRLGTALPAIGPEAARAAAGGERPVFRVPRAGLPRLVEAMERRELATRAVPVVASWGALPPKAWMLAGAAVTAGAVAGSVALPMLFWTSPVVGTLVLLGANRDARTPLVAPPVRSRALPKPLERTVVDALVSLPPGTVRGLLADIVRASESLFATIARTGDERGLATSLGELVTAACRAALDLSDLDENLTRFERQRERFVTGSAERLDALSRCERTRDALVQRLLEAMTAVARLRTQHAELAGEGDSTLADLTRELQAEAAAQSAAAKEIEALLSEAT